MLRSVIRIFFKPGWSLSALLIASESMSHSVMLHKVIKKQNDLNTSVLVYVQNI